MENGGGAHDPDHGGEPRTTCTSATESLAQLYYCVPLFEAGPSLDHGDVEQFMGHQAVTNVKMGKTSIDRCWGRNDVYDGGGICDACGTELQEQCVQDDVRLASCAAERACEVHGPSARSEKFFGVVREAWDCTSSCRGLRLTQRNGSICSDSSPSSSCCTYSRCESYRCVLLFFALKSIYNTLSPEYKRKGTSIWNKPPKDNNPLCKITVSHRHQP